MKNLQEGAIEFALEYARVAVVSVIPVLIISLQMDKVDWKAIGVLAAVAALKALDRALHETKIEEKGIVRF